MHVANCTDQDAEYTVDDGGGRKELAAGRHRSEFLQVGNVVIFFVEGKEVARSVKLTSIKVIVSLFRIGGIFAVGITEEV